MQTERSNTISFNDLVSTISSVHYTLTEKTNKTINVCATIRNWLIGFYIQEYEQQGKDRARYGEKLLETLAADLFNKGIPGCSGRNLWLFRKFYQSYPRILQTLSAEFKSLKIINAFTIPQTVSAESDRQQKITGLRGEELLQTLSFSHFVEILKLDDPLKRAFYELECVKCAWSVRELKRQIGSLYYERMGLSKNKGKLAEFVRSKKTPESMSEIIRDPYIFEFLGLKPHEVMYENNLRDALVGKLQDFMLELGKGFCFEARNKRILIGDEYFFIDLVFYHRILKCNVLLELKLRPFKHGDMSQLNTYLNYYKKNEMLDSDQPPIGILLCTEKNHALVEYAAAGVDNQVFISKYSLQLPTKKEIQAFVEQELQMQEATP